MTDILSDASAALKLKALEAAVLTDGMLAVYTDSPDDWNVFADDGLSIVGPASTLARL